MLKKKWGEILIWFQGYTVYYWVTWNMKAAGLPARPWFQLRLTHGSGYNGFPFQAVGSSVGKLLLGVDMTPQH